MLVFSAGCGGPEPSERFTLRPAAIDDELVISVRRPPGTAPAAGWPLAVVLDANWHFAAAQERLEALIDAGRVSETLLVGIGYHGDVETRRSRDFAIPRNADPRGGARAFLTFLEDDLLPELMRRYPVSAALEQRILLGHSLGALLAAQALLRQPALFRGYGLGAPAFWPQDFRIFTLERDYAAANRDLPADVVMTAGFQDGPEITVGVPAFARALAGRSYPGLHLDWSIRPDHTHTSIIPAFLDHAFTRLLAGPEPAREPGHFDNRLPGRP
jgi:predicted alpha/beta superfamily hydrolase